MQRKSSLNASELREVSHDIFSWRLNPFDFDFDTLFSFTVDIFQYYDLLTKFGINHKKLKTFLTNLKSEYHDNPFHNFEHVWSVFQISFLILQNGADKFLESNDIFSILISALCHDLDHPGNNNTFEKAKNSALYLKYQCNAVLESHHKYMARALLSQTECNLMEEMSNTDHDQILELLDHAIMSTDMALHFGLMDILEKHSKLSPTFNKASFEDRKTLVGLIVHCADLSGQALTLDLAQFWGTRVTQEFINQSNKESELGLPLSPFMLGLDNELVKMKMQVGFVTTFIIPQWTLMSMIVPALHAQAMQSTANRDFYANRVAALSLEVTKALELSQPQPQTQSAATVTAESCPYKSPCVFHPGKEVKEDGQRDHESEEYPDEKATHEEKKK